MEKVSEKKVSKKSAKKNNKKLILVASAIVVLAVLFLVLQSGILTSYKFSFQRSGVQYYSNEYSPSEFFSAFKDVNEVYVSPEVIEGKTDQLVVNSMNIWQVVLISKGQSAIQLVRVYGGTGSSQEGQLLYCHTNWGDTNKSVQISTQECNEILSDGGKMKVLIDKSGEDKVILSKGKMQIFYSNSQTVSSLNLKIIEQIYPDAAEIIKKINDIIGQVS
ncbi:MAG: hypothetical protein WC308_00160 [archaeon]|jgi:hypothetical protein